MSSGARCLRGDQSIGARCPRGEVSKLQGGDMSTGAKCLVTNGWAIVDFKKVYLGLITV